jgi:D-alanyl-D-alanine dipeptidase
MAGSLPGPICVSRLPSDWIDEGTNALCRMPGPGPTGTDADEWPGLLPVAPWQTQAQAAAQSLPTASVPTLELSGAQWVSRFPTSTSTDDLVEPFRSNVRNFVAALTAAGASVRVSATLRPPERAYLMHYASRVSSGKLSADKVPARSGVNINWVHPTAADSIAAATDMVNGYGIVFPPALDSNHSRGTAIDMTITGIVGKSMNNASGNAVAIQSQNDLHEVGASYGVRKLISDPPHWSSDGH